MNERLLVMGLRRGTTAVCVPLLAAAAWGCRGQVADRPPRAEAARASVERVVADSTFAGLIASLSEPGGYFDTDNLISNERSYLHVLGRMRSLRVRGGAYVGVGPDQNFSYIAAVRPRIAFIVDIRRDNMLQHLMFKALFALAENRMEYLALLTGRDVPANLDAWTDRSINAMVDRLDLARGSETSRAFALAVVESTVTTFGVPLSQEDLATIDRFHRAFIDAGLGLRFRSHGRASRPYYPTYRQLLLETDLTGRQGNYLADEEDFRFLKSLQRRDLIIPVVGDLAGDHALRAIGRVLAERGARVSAFYTSNVEFYLMRGGSFSRFAENVVRLPHDERSVIIRSYFGGPYRYRHPQNVPGYFSTQLLQTMDSFVREYRTNGYRSYFDLVNQHVLELQ